MIAEVFRRAPVERQPRCIAVFGRAGDECWKKFMPEGLPVHLVSDLRDPGKFLAELGEKGLNGQEDVLYVYSFLRPSTASHCPQPGAGVAGPSRSLVPIGSSARTDCSSGSFDRFFGGRRLNASRCLHPEDGAGGPFSQASILPQVPAPDCVWRVPPLTGSSIAPTPSVRRKFLMCLLCSAWKNCAGWNP